MVVGRRASGFVQVHFDPATETFGEDRAANACLTKQYREPYSLPVV
jgi:hypothetical protein